MHAGAAMLDYEQLKQVLIEEVGEEKAKGIYREASRRTKDEAMKRYSQMVAYQNTQSSQFGNRPWWDK